MFVRAANLALSFLLELGMLAAFGYWGYHASDTIWIEIVLGSILPVAAASIWGVFMAPKAKIPLRQIPHLLLALVLFGLATTALFASNQPAVALVFGILVVLNQTLTYLLRQ